MTSRRQRPRPPNPPADGERHAQRGYIPQYDLGASLAYDALARGDLKWVGLADRSAGKFDDFVLGLGNQTEAYQVKTRDEPARFSIRTLLMGAGDWLALIINSRQSLLAADATQTIITTYVCDDSPFDDDALVGQPGTSSAEFLQIHAAHGATWSLADWDRSPFGPFTRELQQSSGLDDEGFLTVWQNARFWHSGSGRLQADKFDIRDLDRLAKMAALWPRLVADRTSKDRWTKEEILSRLGWRDPFQLRHQHVFPIDAFYLSNDVTRAALANALRKNTSGYLSLVGPPGSGKSSLLAGDMLPIPRAVLARYVAFIPNEGHGLGRAEATNFLHDLIKQLKAQGLGAKIYPGTDLEELRAQFEALLREAGERYKDTETSTAIVVDGLDHVPREETPAQSFLRQLPLPHAIPDGVIFVIGTQTVDLPDLPKSVRDQASEDGRRVELAPLSRDAVARLADLAKVPADVDRGILFDRTLGHPLSCRYVIRGLLDGATPEDRQNWLQDGPAYGGEINTFYDRAWHALEDEVEAREALGYLAWAEASLRIQDLDCLVGRVAAEKAIKVAKHLLRRDKAGGWAIFHNSFRLYLQAKLGDRHGQPDQEGIAARLRALAELASKAQPGTPQCWMELRYWARAGNHAAVAAFACATRFRSEFVEGRSLSEIRADQRLAFEAAKVLRNADLMFDLILSQHEVSMRASMLGDEVFDAYLALGDLDAARNLLNADGISLSVVKGYGLVAALMLAGRADEAREVFHEIEPIDKLLGSEPVAHTWHDDELDAWAGIALAFRSPVEFLASVERLHIDNAPLGERNPGEFRDRLKGIALEGQIYRHPDKDLDELGRGLGLEDVGLPRNRFLAAVSAHRAQKFALATEHLIVAARDPLTLGYRTRIDAATLAIRLKQRDTAAALIADLKSPLLYRNGTPESDTIMRDRSYQVARWAAINGELGLHASSSTKPAEDLHNILHQYQGHLATLGRLLGEIRSARQPSANVVGAIRRMLDFLEHADAQDRYRHGRYLIDRTVDVAVDLSLTLAAEAGQEPLKRCVLLFDERLANHVSTIDNPIFRRGFARALFRHGYGSDAAAERLALDRLGSHDHSPSEAILEFSLTATALADLGLPELAREVLRKMHQHGLGFDRAPKKDPQYFFWSDAFTKANAADPAGRADRLSFLGRLLDGMSNFTGASTARRLVRAFLIDAVQHSAATAIAATNFVESADLTSWPKLVAALLDGVVQTRPELALAAGEVAGRLALPTSNDDIQNPFLLLIAAAPTEQVEMLVANAISLIESHAPSIYRVRWLEETSEAAGQRGVSVDPERIEDWRSELPKLTTSSSQASDAEIESLSDLTATLAASKETYWAPHTFARLVETAEYVEARSVFDGHPFLKGSRQSLAALVESAHRAGRIGEAREHLADLAKLAKSEGGWTGGWFSDASEKYHRLKILLDGPQAKAEAFDSFLDDLRDGREPVELLLSSMGDVIELLSPRPSWPVLWTASAGYLAEYRDYQSGRPFEVPVEGLSDSIEVIVDILVRALDTTALELQRLVHESALALLDVPSGPEIVARLVERLINGNPHQQMDSARIGWVCRQDVAVKGRLLTHLPILLCCRDLAVRATGMRMAEEWGIAYQEPEGGMPAFYGLEFVEDPAALRFDPPSGFSSSSSGLMTASPYEWTWCLKHPLTLLSRMTGISIDPLRRRAAQLMAEQGGLDAFGPLAIKEQQRRLRVLNLEILYHKLPPRAALLAMRQLVGELEAAGVIGASWPMAAILYESGAYQPSLQAGLPFPRPPGASRPTFPDYTNFTKTEDWLADVGEDLHSPEVDDGIVLAATSFFTLQRHEGELLAEHFYGPNFGEPKEDLGHELNRLPCVIVQDLFMTLYEGEAEGAIVQVRPDIAHTIPNHVLTICPRVTQKLGWRREPDNLLTIVDANCDVMVDTVYWRDGGITRLRPPDASGQGCLLVASEAGATALAPYLTRPRIARAWRIIEPRDGEKKSRSASKDLHKPFS